MHAKQAKLGRFGVAILAVLAVGAGLSGRAYTQYRASLKSMWMSRNAQLVAGAEMERAEKGAPDDWSHRHLVFSNPGPEENAIQNGRYDSWLHITNDPRFIMQQKKRAVGSKQLADRKVFAAASGNSGLISPVVNKGGRAGGKQAAPIHRDWAIGLGTGNPTQATYPAKWSFDTTTASCSGDFVAYPTGAAGAAGVYSIDGRRSYSGSTEASDFAAWNGLADYADDAGDNTNQYYISDLHSSLHAPNHPKWKSDRHLVQSLGGVRLGLSFRW
jgi:hypothetical protein